MGLGGFSKLDNYFLFPKICSMSLIVNKEQVLMLIKQNPADTDVATTS